MFVLHSSQNSEIFYATALSAGFDICAAENVTLPPGEWRTIGTGLRIVESLPLQNLQLTTSPIVVLPELQIRPRSGLAAKSGITVLNAPSTIDADYRGEIRIILINHSKSEFFVKQGDRIAQGVCSLICQISNVTVIHKERGTGGFGSTGI